MSCGTPHETDCAEVLDRVFGYLDGELGPQERSAIREHLDECAPCLRQYGLEQAVKALVARCCGREVAPDGLRELVLVRLRSIRVEVSGGEPAD